MLVKVTRGALKSLAAFFTAGVALALDPTPSFTLQSWEVLAKEGGPAPRGSQSSVVNASCYILCNQSKVPMLLSAEAYHQTSLGSGNRSLKFSG